jgi:hypothetical protein
MISSAIIALEFLAIQLLQQVKRSKADGSYQMLARTP